MRAGAAGPGASAAALFSLAACEAKPVTDPAADAEQLGHQDHVGHQPREHDRLRQVRLWRRGVFGIKAASEYYFKTTPDKLSLRQAAALASIL
ncbi:transglycosylase domain-containing protein, partial [Paracoccus sp. APAP_BH8]|uniref:transglycosylase domain-containing protein n=1 Tax=Paracoccus sp. APAP_BH8 TaxID=3110237 RepID=UPI003FA68E5A